jgi:AcrR family transcriptional regulator
MSAPNSQLPDMPKRIPKQQRSKDTVDRIIRAATQIIRRDGFGKFSTNAVAAKAGVGIASIYEYFEDKDAVLVAVLEREIPELWSALEERLPRWLESDVDTALRDLFSFAVGEIRSRANTVGAAAAYVHGPAPLPSAARLLGQIEMLFRLLLGKFSRRTDRDPALDAYLVTHAFVGIGTGIAAGLPPGKTENDVVDWLVHVSKGVLGV